MKGGLKDDANMYKHVGTNMQTCLKLNHELAKTEIGENDRTDCICDRDLKKAKVKIMPETLM